MEDEDGQSPLFTTKYGRVTRATIRRDFYKLTRPCMYSGECPHHRVISACEGTKGSKTEECPSRYSTHPFRKWSIMHQLDAGVSMELLSDRVDVSVPILEILQLLLSNARRPYSDIADVVGLSAPAVSDRVARLQEMGITNRFTLDVDRSQLRKGIPVLVSTRSIRRAGPCRRSG